LEFRNQILTRKFYNLSAAACKAKMTSSSSSSVGSVGAPFSDDELAIQGNVMIQNDVVSPTLNTNEASLGIATLGIAFQPDPSLLWPNGWIHQASTWYGGRPQPRGLCVRWGPSPPQKRGGALNFRPMSIAAKRLHGSRCHLVQR